METWIYTLPVILIISLAGYANNQTGAKVHEHLLLAVTLPEKALADERVKRLVRRYSVCNRICLVITLLAVLPFFLRLQNGSRHIRLIPLLFQGKGKAVHQA